MYNSVVLGHVTKPDHMESLENPDFIGQEGLEGEGPWLTIQLRVTGDRIECARFQTYGCPAAVASGNWLARWVEGKTADEAAVIGMDDLMRMLGGLPLGKEHCARLAVTALQSALAQWKEAV